MTRSARGSSSATRQNRSSGGVRPLTGGRLVEALIGGWRPLTRLDVEGFAMLRSRGVTRRANSTIALDAPGDDDALNAAIDRIEGLYEAVGERARFRVLDVHGPARLDELLAARGYTEAAPCELLERPLPGKRTPPPHPSAVVRTGALDASWFEASWRLAPRSEDGARETLRDIMAGTPAVQVLLPGDDGPVAAGRAALVATGRTRAAVLNAIAVHPEHRRQGLGRDLSATLLALATAQSADRALLEVERDNAAARALYRQLGFGRIGGYHYRERP